MIYTTREEAGKRLARRVHKYLGVNLDVVVLALSREGVVVGDKLARKLQAPLDLFPVKSINLPGFPEVELGAVDRDGTYALNPVAAPHVDAILFQAERLRNIRSANFESLYLSNETLNMELSGKTVVLVDDGILTGTGALAAIDMACQHSAEEVIVAAPLISRPALALLDAEADVVIVDSVPGIMVSVADYYQNYVPESDTKVKQILQAYSLDL